MTKTVTYQQMEKALTTLGFEKVEPSEYTVFANREYDALIVLPKDEGKAVVSPAHRLTIERTVTEKGIVAADTFARILRGTRPRRRVYARRGPVAVQTPETAPIPRQPAPTR